MAVTRHREGQPLGTRKRVSDEALFALLRSTGGESDDVPKLWSLAALTRSLGWSETAVETRARNVVRSFWGQISLVYWRPNEMLVAGRVVADPSYAGGSSRRYLGCDLVMAAERAEAKGLQLVCQAARSSYAFRLSCTRQANGRDVGMNAVWTAELVGRGTELVSDSS